MRDIQIEFRRLVDEMYDASLLVDVASRTIVYGNAAAEALLGYPVDELAQMSPADIHPHEIPRVEAFLDAVMASGNWTSDALSCRARSGQRIPADVRATRIRFDDRDFVFLVIRDLRTEQLARLGASVRAVAHDLRNTLATAQLLTERLAEADDARVRRSADVLARSIGRAVAMCTDAVMTGRSGERTLDRMRFLLVDLVEELEATVKPSSPDAPGVRGEAAETVALDADYDQLYRLFLNLARNAFAAGASSVVIQPDQDRSTADMIAITVCDDGPGLPADAEATLFEEKSWRSDASGLGLSIAREIALAHGGELRLVENGPEGACFELRLPR
ncbi:histidine kinase [Marinicauda salina]|uniref:histidine kinase n=1 Tax=Marinicauda salina TaxID=2135793 RepID=A0A2U2BUX5_9PROT|nr:PAS domain-containing sensor histidine kinase [Marinicauda salina]PWE17764.1 histidine kinase [Marinicauda salina]